MIFKLMHEMKAAHGLLRGEPGVEKASGPITSFQGFDQLGTDALGDVEAYNTIYENLVWAHRAVKKKAESLSKIPLRVWRDVGDGEREELTDNPEFRIFQRPNPTQTPNDFFSESYQRLDLQGELFWEIIRDQTGRPIEVYPYWRSEQVRIIGNAQDWITAFKVNRGGKTETVSAEDVFYMRYFNPLSDFRGLSPLRVGRHSSTLELQALAFNKKFFKQGGKLSGILQTPQRLTDEEARRFQRTFEKMYAGTENMHKTAVLWNGIEFKPVNNMTMRDAEFMQLRQMNREEIAGLFDVPFEVLGFGQATYENKQWAWRQFWGDTLQNFSEKIIQHINIFFVPQLTDDPDVYVEHDFSGVEALQEDADAVANRYLKAEIQGVVTKNEVRQSDAFNLEAREEDGMDEPRRLSEPTSPAPGTITEEPPPSEERGFRFLINRSKVAVIGNDAGDQELTKAWELQVKQVEPFEDNLTSSVREFFAGFRRDVIDNLSKGAYFVEYPLGSSKQENGGVTLTHTKVLTVSIDVEKQIEKLLAKMEGPYIAALIAAGQSMADLGGTTFNVQAPAILNAIGGRLNFSTSSIVNTTRRQIEQIIEEANVAGLSLDQLAARLNAEVFDYAELTRSRIIARTETFYATNNGNLEGMRQSKFQTKVWVSSRDERVRETHRLMDGVRIPVDEDFTLPDGSVMPFPQEINERCIILPGDNN